MSRVKEKIVLFVTDLAEIKIFGKGTRVFQPDYQAIDTKDPKEMGISQESHSGRRKRYQPEQNLSPGKRFHTALRRLRNGGSMAGGTIV